MEEHVPQDLTWSYEALEFNMLPVFSDLNEQIEDVLGQLFQHITDKIQVRLNYQLPQEDKVFAHMSYHLSCILCEGCLSPGGTNIKGLIDDLAEKYRHQITFSERVTSELLFLDLEMPITDVEIIEDAPPVNMEELEAKIGDPEMRQTLIELFVEQAPARLNEWQKAFKAGDLQAAHRIIHSMKGSALNMSAHRLAQKARRLEMQLKIHHTEEAEELFSLINDELGRVIQFLKPFL